MSGTGIHRLIYRDICVERGASYAACAAHNKLGESLPRHVAAPPHRVATGRLAFTQYCHHKWFMVYAYKGGVRWGDIYSAIVVQ